MEGPPGEVPVLKSLWLRGGLCRHFDNWQEFAHDVPPIGDPDRIRTAISALTESKSKTKHSYPRNACID